MRKLSRNVQVCFAVSWWSPRGLLMFVVVLVVLVVVLVVLRWYNVAFVGAALSVSQNKLLSSVLVQLILSMPLMA